MAAYVIYPTDEQEKLMKVFLAESGIPFIKDDDEELPQHVLDGIAKGQAAFEAGRTITLEEFKKRLMMYK